MNKRIKDLRDELADKKWPPKKRIWSNEHGEDKIIKAVCLNHASFREGFNACYELLEKENQRLREALGQAHGETMNPKVRRIIKAALEGKDDA